MKGMGDIMVSMLQREQEQELKKQAVRRKRKRPVRHPWTEADKAIIVEYWDRGPVFLMTKMPHRTRSSIREYLRKHRGVLRAGAKTL